MNELEIDLREMAMIVEDDEDLAAIFSEALQNATA